MEVSAKALPPLRQGCGPGCGCERLEDNGGEALDIPGCKHVAIGVADNGEKVYMLDITRSHIVLMEPVKADAKKDKEVSAR